MIIWVWGLIKKRAQKFSWNRAMLQIKVCKLYMQNLSKLHKLATCVKSALVDAHNHIHAAAQQSAR